MRLFSRIPPRWRTLVKIVLTWTLTSPFLITQLCGSNVTSKCAGVAVCMALMWALELAPLSVTALTPLIAFPLLGIQSGKTVSREYMNDTLMVVFGSALFGAAIEAYDLHRMFALWILSHVGLKSRQILLAFMVAAALISMWLSNTATAVLLMPMAVQTLDFLDPASRAAAQLRDKRDSPDENSHRHDDDDDDDHTSEDDGNDEQHKNTTAEKTIPTLSTRAAFIRYRKALVIAVGYACTLGGMATTIGTGTNLTLIGILPSLFADPPTPSFTTWMLFGLPLSICLILATWVVLVRRSIGLFSSSKDPLDHLQGSDYYFTAEYDKLGPMTMNQKLVLCNFSALIVLWFTRDFGFAPGWSNAFNEPSYVTDGTVCIGLAFLFFIVPKKEQPNFQVKPYPTSRLKKNRKKVGLPSSSSMPAIAVSGSLLAYHSFEDDADEYDAPPDSLELAQTSVVRSDEKISPTANTIATLPSVTPSSSSSSSSDEILVQVPTDAAKPDALLDKKAIQKAPWGTLLLLGGAFALASGFESSGLTECVADSLEFLESASWVLVIVIICIVASILSEFTSNVATNTILLPIIKAIAISMGINPMAMMIPVTLACSCSFMLPISTPPNSISYATGYYTTWEMIQTGLVIKIICLTIIISMFLTLGLLVFGIDVQPLPAWALEEP